jgi:Helicase associated domain
MGFDFKRRINYGVWDTTRQALQVYKDLHGHLLVPQVFVIPTDDPKWPEQIRGLKLGEIVSGIRTKGYYQNYKDELQEMGFCFERLRNRVKKPKHVAKNK